MAKKKRGPQLEAWCWYCDREFEDDKVLIQHQKAKHFKCSFCPRRLNTAGGLTVHLHQVHKAEPGRIENALPGRDSFDTEIYGMVGIPEADLAEWQSRKASGSGGSGQQQAKRPKIESVALTPEQLKAQLQAHKALMSGQALPPGSIPPQFGHGQPQIGAPAGSPPGHFSARPPPAHFGPPPGYPPNGPLPGAMPPFNGPPPPHRWTSSGPIPNVSAPPTLSAHQVAVRDGAKSRMVYADHTLSPEEKLASSSKYAYVDPDDPIQQQEQQRQQIQQQQEQWQSQVPAAPYYAGPPPGWPPAGPPPGFAPPSMGSSPPYPPPSNSAYPGAAGSPYQAFPRPPPSFAGSPQSTATPPPSFSSHAHSASPYSGPPLTSYPPPPSSQSYSAPQGQTQSPVQSHHPANDPPAAQPEANTAEALAATMAAAPEATSGEWEKEVRDMKSEAEAERQSDEKEAPVIATEPLSEQQNGSTVAQTNASPASSTQARTGPGRRAKAADLF